MTYLETTLNFIFCRDKTVTATLFVESNPCKSISYKKHIVLGEVFEWISDYGYTREDIDNPDEFEYKSSSVYDQEFIDIYIGCDSNHRIRIEYK